MLHWFSLKKILLIAVFALLLIKELVFVTVIPPWQGHDEPAHFAYTQYLVEAKRLPVFQGNFTDPKILSFSEEYAKSEIITGATRMMVGTNEQYRLVHQKFSENPASARALANQLSGLGRLPLNRSTASPEYLSLYYKLPAQDIYQNSAAIYQPLYYALMAVPYKLFYGQNILVRLYAMRIFSSLLYLGTLVICYLAAMRLAKNYLFPLTLTVLIGLQPVYSHLAAGLNNEILLIFLATLAIYWCIRLIQNFSWRHTVWLGLTLGLGMLSKPQFIIFLIVALVPFIYHFFWRKIVPRKKILLCAAIGFSLVIAIAGWWFLWNYQHYGAFIKSESLTAASQTSENTLAWSAAWPYYFQRWFYAFLSFNFLFGFATEMYLPLPVMILGSTLIVLGIIGLIKLIIQKYKDSTAEQKAQGCLLLSSFCLLELFLLYLFSKNLFLRGQANFPSDGRYYLPVIFSLGCLWLAGMAAWLPKKIHNLAFLLMIIGALAVNCLAIWHVIIPNFYL